MALGNAPIGSGGVNSFLTYAAQIAGGLITNGVIENGRLYAQGISPFWLDDPRTFYASDVAPFWTDAFKALTYETPIVEPTVAIEGATMTLDLEMAGEAQAIQYRFAELNPIWSGNDLDAFFRADADPFYADSNFALIPFSTWPGQAVANGRSYQFRFTTGAGSRRGMIGKCRLLVDVPDVEVRINDYPVPQGGARLPFYGKTFAKIVNVLLTLQADGGTAVRVQVLEKSASVGVLVACYDAAGAPAAGTVDAIILGY